jgi:CheY-like chemotaxis protein
MKQILIADDKASGRELIRTIMENSGYTVIEAANGSEALEHARASQPDLIVLDLHMPGLDGFSLVAELRRDARFASTPIIALTACAMVGDQERAKAAGFSTYVTKPVSILALRQRMLYLLENGASRKTASSAG